MYKVTGQFPWSSLKETDRGMSAELNVRMCVVCVNVCDEKYTRSGDGDNRPRGYIQTYKQCLLINLYTYLYFLLLI